MTLFSWEVLVKNIQPSPHSFTYQIRVPLILGYGCACKLGVIFLWLIPNNVKYLPSNE